MFSVLLYKTVTTTLSKPQGIKKKKFTKIHGNQKWKIKRVNKTKSKEKSDGPLIPTGIKWQWKLDAVPNTSPKSSKDDNDEIDLVYSLKVLVTYIVRIL